MTKLTMAYAEMAMINPITAYKIAFLAPVTDDALPPDRTSRIAAIIIIITAIAPRANNNMLTPLRMLSVSGVAAAEQNSLVAVDGQTTLAALAVAGKKVAPTHMTVKIDNKYCVIFFIKNSLL